MWVNPDAAAASPGNLAIIAASGPLSRLAVGTICGVLYWSIYRSRPTGLFFLTMCLIGIYFFLGPMVGASFGGDCQAALEFINAPSSVRLAATALGIVLLAFWMFCVGEELTRWVPSQADRTAKVRQQSRHG
jgi:predicted transporter